MVDFRYHLVSIIAVFLALAVGIVLGATAIEGPAYNTLNNRVTAVGKDRDALRATNDELIEQLAKQSRFAEAVLPFAAAGRLADERVVIVSAPGASAQVGDTAAQALQTAGAAVVGRLSLTDKFADPAYAAALTSVARQVVNGASVGEGTPLQRAANQLATAVATPTRDGASGFNSETDRIVRLFTEADLVRVDGGRAGRSPVIVIVAPLPEKIGVAGREERVRSVNEVVAAFARQAAAVVTISPTGGAAEGGVLSSLRRDQNLATDVGSVDHADTAAGQASLVLAIAEQLRPAAEADGVRRAAGHYGDGPGADRALPDLANVS